MPFGIKLDAMILAPLIYIAIIAGSMATFSSLYRKRQALQQSSMDPWFPPSTPRDIYLSLLHTEPTPPDSVLRAALIRRAVTVIHRAIKIRNQKPPLTQLLQRGSISDDTWTQFVRAEQLLDAELKEVMEEANSLTPEGLQPPWGQFIFQSAAEIAHNELFAAKVGKEREKTETVALEWKSSKEGKEKRLLGGEAGVSQTATPPATPIPVRARTPIPSVLTTTPSRKEEKSSDEDGVLVEAVKDVAAKVQAAAAAEGTLTPQRPTPQSTPSGSMRKKKGGSMRKK